jgi:hypothetical protein
MSWILMNASFLSWDPISLRSITKRIRLDWKSARVWNVPKYVVNGHKQATFLSITVIMQFVPVVRVQLIMNFAANFDCSKSYILYCPWLDGSGTSLHQVRLLLLCQSILSYTDQ